MKTQRLNNSLANHLARLGAIACLWFGLIFGFLPSGIASANGSILYVVPGGKGSGACGASWSDACDLHRALTIAAGQASSTVTVQIAVEEGTYKPTGGTDQTLSWGLVNHVEILGGYSWDGERADHDQAAMSPFSAGTSAPQGTPRIILFTWSPWTPG